MSKTWVLASGNRKKIEEMSAILAPWQIDLRSQAQWQVPEAAETGLSFVENALLKARQAARYTGQVALADDSGLCVPALRGAPGLYSARYAGEHSADLNNNQKLLQEMKNLSGEARRAFFVCVIVVLRHAEDPLPLIAQGVWHGVIAQSAHGNNGFGYDPLFYLPDRGCTSAELAPEEKNRLSHRAQALRSLIQQLETQDFA